MRQKLVERSYKPKPLKQQCVKQMKRNDRAYLSVDAGKSQGDLLEATNSNRLSRDKIMSQLNLKKALMPPLALNTRNLSENNRKVHFSRAHSQGVMSSSPNFS